MLIKTEQKHVNNIAKGVARLWISPRFAATRRKTQLNLTQLATRFDLEDFFCLWHVSIFRDLGTVSFYFLSLFLLLLLLW